MIRCRRGRPHPARTDQATFSLLTGSNQLSRLLFPLIPDTQMKVTLDLGRVPLFASNVNSGMSAQFAAKEIANTKHGERTVMKFRFLGSLLLAASIFCLLACSSRNSTSTQSGTGLLYLTAQGNATISALSVSLSSGSLGTIGSAAATGAFPSAIAITPSVNALFVANTGANNISSYQINSDGSLAAVSGTAATGASPMGLAIDPGGKFLFVANQGTFADPKSGSISVFSINGTSLTQVSGSPFLTEEPGASTGTGPVALAIPPSGNFLYVANEFTNTVSAFSFNAGTGALTAVGGSPYPVGLSPSGLAISPAGIFLLVANTGDNTVSSFAICAAQSATCQTPDGTMTQVGTPFPAGVGPAAIAFDPGFNFVYVVDRKSFQVSEYSFGSTSGVLTPLSAAAISTGTTPVSIAIRSGATGTNIGNTATNPTDYVYVANIGGSSMSAFTLNTTTGLLTVLGSPVTTAGQPSALAAK